jgi:hypothetical protein
MNTTPMPVPAGEPADERMSAAAHPEENVAVRVSDLVDPLLRRATRLNLVEMSDPVAEAIDRPIGNQSTADAGLTDYSAPFVPLVDG